MAPVATPPRTRDDSPDTLDDGPDTLEASAPALDAPTSPTDSFDELFVQPVDARVDPASLPALPDGWRHAALVQRAARQPRERRETILAAGFALVAALWAPLGVVAVLTGSILLFVAVSVAAVLLVAAPRPVGASEVLDGIVDRAGPAMDRLQAAGTAAMDRVRTAGTATLERFATTVRGALAGLRARRRDHSSPSSAR